MKKGPVWHPCVSSTSDVLGSARASVTTPGWNGSSLPEATRTGVPARASACVTASSPAKSAADA